MDVLVVELLSPADEGKKALDSLSRKGNFFRFTGNFDLCSPAKDSDSVGFFDFLYILMPEALQRWYKEGAAENFLPPFGHFLN